MRRSLLLLTLLLAPAPVFAGGGGAPRTVTVPQVARPLWTATVDPGSGIESAGYFGVFGVQEGHAVALDHVTGRVKWQSAASDLAGTPLQQQPLVFFSKQGGAVTALDFFTGKERWTVGGGDGPVRLSRGPVLGTAQGTVLASGTHITLALGNETGRFLWRADSVSPEHTLGVERLYGDRVLFFHSPSEGFLGNVYTSHDAATGREVWRLRAGQGYLLGETSKDLIFDLRDWQNQLGEGGTVRAARVDKETGRRRDLTLRVAVPDAREWQTEPGTLRLDGEGGTWVMAVRVRDRALRLIHTSAGGNTHIWTLPGTAGQLGGASLVLTQAGALVGFSNGHVLLLDPRTGTRRTVLPPGDGAPLISDRLGGVRAIVRDDQTVFLDDDERIRLRVPGRADDWATGGDLQTVMVLRGTRLSGYAWPPFARSLRR